MEFLFWERLGVGEFGHGINGAATEPMSGNAATAINQALN